MNSRGAISNRRTGITKLSAPLSDIFYISSITGIAGCDLVLFMLMLHSRCDHHHAALAGRSPYCVGDIGMLRIYIEACTYQMRRAALAGLERDRILSKQATAIVMTSNAD